MILRSIPNKLEGVIALVASVVILMISLFTHTSKLQSPALTPLIMFCFDPLLVMMLLTWIGAWPVEDPYVLVGQILTILYFLFNIISPLLLIWWDFF